MRNHSDIALVVLSALRELAKGADPFPVHVNDSELADKAAYIQFLAQHEWLLDAAKEFLADQGQTALLAELP